jgi:hypothetical protein
MNRSSLSSSRIENLTIQKDHSQEVLDSVDVIKRINDSHYSLSEKPSFKKAFPSQVNNFN